MAKEALSALGILDSTPLAYGGQKVVYKAQLSGQPVVAKVVFLPDGPARSIALMRAHREVELMAAIDSDHFVKVLSDAIEVGDPIEAVAWVEEYLDGEDLSHASSTVWSDKELFTLLRDVAEGLKACHELEVVHRDLSPGNVRRLDSGRFVIMDPGLARHLERTVVTGLFQPGTNGFRSPEHVYGGTPIPASDIFGVGILAFYLRTGRLPIELHIDDREYNRMLAEEQAPSILALDPTLDPTLAAVIDRCLARQASRRYLDGDELSTELSEIFEGEPWLAS